MSKNEDGKDSVKTEKGKKFLVRSLVGSDMIDVTTNTVIPVSGVVLDKVTSFIQCQKEAKKMSVQEIADEAATA